MLPSSLEPLKVLGLQLSNRDAATAADVAFNCRLASDAIVADSGKHHIYALGEMYTTGYSDDVMRAIPRLAEPLELGASVEAQGSSFVHFSAVARRVNAFIVYGFPRVEPASKQYFISVAVVGPDGELVCVYDKLHVCGIGVCSEASVFTAGDRVVTFEAHGWTVGLMICYDIRFPELARELSWTHGADVILHPSAFPRDETFASWMQFVVTRAIENQVYFMSISRAGKFFGGSIAMTPFLDESKDDLQPTRLDTGAGHLSMVADPSVLARVRLAVPLRRDVHSTLCANAPRLTGPAWSRNMLPPRTAQLSHTKRDTTGRPLLRTVAACDDAEGSSGWWLAGLTAALCAAAVGAAVVARRRGAW